MFALKGWLNNEFYERDAYQDDRRPDRKPNRVHIPLGKKIIRPCFGLDHESSSAFQEKGCNTVQSCPSIPYQEALLR